MNNVKNSGLTDSTEIHGTDSTDRISDEEIMSINRAIFSRYGFDFSNYELKSYKRRVIRIIDRFDLENSIGLWKKIINDPDFIRVYIDEISVGLTEMFRNPDMWVGLRENILPRYQQQSRLNIWHAGCSTGEEVYSMAILLEEEALIGKTSVLASDMNTSSIQQAKEGAFSSMYKTKYTTNYYATKSKASFADYYTDNTETMHFDKVNMNPVRFVQNNLVKETRLGNFDMIFCRNVMIYFDDILKMKVLKYFYDSLEPDGMLVIGYYDSLPIEYKNYFDLYDPATKMFVRKK
jgi:chemotaxis protein methyltransferase CheR